MFTTRMSLFKGPEPWKTVAGISFTVWDLWFLVLLDTPETPSWERLVAKLKDQSRHSGDRWDSEAKLSHLEDLRHRVIRTGSSPVELIGEDSKIRRIRETAHRHILLEPLPERHMSDAMQHPPRERLYARALRGHWSEFPVSPIDYELLFQSLSRSEKCYGEEASFGLAERMEKRLDKACLGAKHSSARLLAIHRAFLTAMLDLIERADDSYGVLGNTFGEKFERYVLLPWDADIPAAGYYGDLLDFLTWEDYGWSHDYHSLVFRRLPPEQRPLARSILGSLIQELRASHLDYQAQAAAKLLALVPRSRPEARFPNDTSSARTKRQR